MFTNDVDRARDVARQLRAGTVGHNAFRTDFGIAFGGFKQSGLGREGGVEGLHPFLETKTVILDGPPAKYYGSSHHREPSTVRPRSPGTPRGSVVRNVSMGINRPAIDF